MSNFLEEEGQEILDSNKILESLFTKIETVLPGIVREALDAELAEHKKKMMENQKSIMRLQDVIGGLSSFDPDDQEKPDPEIRESLIEKMAPVDQAMNRALDSLNLPDEHDDFGLDVDILPDENPDVFDLVMARMEHADEHVVSFSLDINRSAFDAWYQSVPGQETVDLSSMIAEQIICARHEAVSDSF